jgi:hypothetical protein
MQIFPRFCPILHSITSTHEHVAWPYPYSTVCLNCRNQRLEPSSPLGLVRPLKNLKLSGASLILPTGGSLPHKASVIGSISTRRFALRPSAVVLGITGFPPPRPAVFMRWTPIPLPARYVFTATALNSETVLL